MRVVCAAMQKNGIGLYIYWLFLTSILSGCSKSYLCEEVDIPCEWHSELSSGFNIASSEDLIWWENLQDPLLDELMIDAASRNLDLKIASIQVLQTHQAVAEENLHQVWVTLSAEIAKNYIELRGFQRRLEIMEEAIEIQAKGTQLTQQLLGRGTINESDFSRAQAEWNALKGELPLIKLNITRAIQRISILLGYSSGELFQCLSMSGSLPELPIELSIGIPSELLCRRPDIRKAQRELGAATGWIGTSRLMKEQAFYNYQKTVLEALEESENAIAAFGFEKERLRQLKEVYEHNQNALNFAKDLYQKGIIDDFALTQAKKSLLTAEDLMIRSQIELLLDYVSLYKALGGNWDFE